ncbi:hypothetical protein MAPG_02869 [Magnaporthiopsis poae ATCC 64411]|uniref:DUF218 domain-containing protein n=1 Tax=Magnaporthiopsis poae (strain ATCC 64411 / 73-15) TaxID=644358 RepID=A0A0C4DSI7_MAGP6|nr:hypothetical protein MAPG_02869 [Magnaporthiopsis poae ATCC 64411]
MEAPVPNHLIVVCGHAIWLGGPQKGQDEAEWLIESYKQGETPTFIEHIKAGLRSLGDDDRSALAFSGGPTWKETALSEARSYANLAAANGYFGFISLEDPSTNGAQPHPLSPIPLWPRIILEEQALDSYYNVLFSVVAFWRRYAAWPVKLTIVSHAFKRMRIVDAHCAAIGFPLDRVDFIGIDPPNLPPWLRAVEQLDASAVYPSGQDVSKEKDEVMARGVREVIGQWTEDPHGAGEALAGKRRARNPWGISQRLFHNDEEKVKSGIDTVILTDGTESLINAPQPGVAWRI